ncbi:hypothetical protein TPHA_0E03920 [Tetrapisispora phaffii CBS 4417]|uniref:Protein PBN1 n=1 Tax=Tetrapisispora phaffii (strain ATCC 24235 / CBS 4417 / NBRC 1672 / NRRL Y-8282 / UCD 70-5) TaxID=1071381 RepID=G8BUA3_TETPH|nr:hypothetical protein TPHA_0E03920 [Tetrapisispora phaffii CBS 4417]CCE63481.1 hypothetical protein TPHA_0E03920 [Tetrapisispora phaffii CBS 4417]
MSFKNRLTVLLNEKDTFDEYISTNDTHVKVKGKTDGIHLQQRYTIERSDASTKLPDEILRLTWRSIDGMKRPSVIEPFLTFGFNAYTNVNSELLGDYSNSVDSKVYHVFHGDSLLEMEKILLKYEDIPTKLIDFDMGNDYDIIIDNKSVQINEYKILHENDIFEYGKSEFFDFDKMEAGIFNLESQDDIDTNLGGISCIWRAEDNNIEKCQKTMLLFKSGHIEKDQRNEKNIIEIEQPVGLHPKLLVNLTDIRVSDDQCNIYMFLQLPLEIFVDQYQSDPFFLFGEHDLELPSYKLKDKAWGSETLFELEPGMVNEITLHSRYVEPFSNLSENLNMDDHFISHIEPIVFEECATGALNLKSNPFYSKNLGLEAFFTEDTIFKHIETKSFNIPIPRPNSSEYEATVYITVFCLVTSIIYLLYKMFGKLSSKPTTIDNSSTEIK